MFAKSNCVRGSIIEDKISHQKFQIQDLQRENTRFNRLLHDLQWQNDQLQSELAHINRQLEHSKITENQVFEYEVKPKVSKEVQTLNLKYNNQQVQTVQIQNNTGSKSVPTHDLEDRKYSKIQTTSKSIVHDLQRSEFTNYYDDTESETNEKVNLPPDRGKNSLISNGYQQDSVT